jgi:hypothetical protein
VTKSKDFPTTPGAYDTSFNPYSDWWDVFVTKLSPDGSSLVYSTYLGLGVSENITVALDGAGFPYVSGFTVSPGFPTTPGAYDTKFNGDTDIFVTKLARDGSGLVYSTFLGGNGHEFGSGTAVDSSGAALVTGSTSSSDFPVTGGAYDTTHSSGDRDDAFVTKLSPGGDSLEYSTFLGGSDSDEALGIAVDPSGAALIAGYTRSSDFPTTPGAFDTAFSDIGSSNAFVTKLSPDGTSLVFSTFLGSQCYAFGIGVDPSGAATVTGVALSDFPTTPGAYDSTFNGASDVFVTRLSPAGDTLLYSTLLGGQGADEVYAIAIILRARCSSRG